MPPPPLAADLCPFLPERFTPESLIAQTLWTMVASLPFVVTLRKMSRRRGVRRWFTTAALFAGVLLTYAFVLIPTASCGGCAGGAFTGGAFGFAFLILAGARKVFFPGPIADHLALGALVAIVPAAYAAGGQIVLREYADAVKAYGYMGEGIKPEDALLAMEDAAGAARPRAFALNEPHAGNFRFDLMGEAHATLPLPDATYMFKAGKLEEGTFCAVPVVGDEWTIADPVPLWYICENDWRMFVSCNDAYEGRYDAKDWYGKTRLEECLNRPERLIAKWREENPISPPPPPMPPSPPPTPPSPPAAPLAPSPPPEPPQAPEEAPPPPEPPGGAEQPPPPEPPAEGMDAGSAATPPPPPDAPTAGVDDAGAEDGGAGNDSGGSGGGEDVAAPPLPPAPPPAPSPPPPYVAPKVFRMYFYEVDFVNHYNEFATLADAAVTQSSIDNRVRVSEAAPRVRLAEEQVPCCDAQAAAATAEQTDLALAMVLPFAVGRVALTVFRTFFPVKKRRREAAFMTRQELKKIKLS